MISALVPVRDVRLCGDVACWKFAYPKIDGIEGRNVRPQLRDDSASRAHAAAAAAGRRAVGVDADAAQADAGGAGRHSLPDVSQQAAALGAPQHFAGQQRAIALHFDIDVVLERQRNHILRREIKIARADQRVEARRIVEIDRRHVSGLVRMSQPAQSSFRGIDSDSGLRAHGVCACSEAAAKMSSNARARTITFIMYLRIP